MVAAAPLVPRRAEGMIDAVLDDTPIAVVQGARQVGKTTLARVVLARRDSRFVTLDDDPLRRAAEADPGTFVEQWPDGCLGIDEIQRVPGLVLALKASVDRDRRPGRFLLTGSADLLRLPATQDSLAGRAESVELFGLSQGELTAHEERFADRLLDGDLFLGAESSVSRHEYMELICAGGYPEAIRRTDLRRRRAWFENYVTRITQRDAADVAALRYLAELPRLLRLLAAHSASEVSRATLSRQSGIHENTLPPYLDLLETLFLIQRVPAWSRSFSRRIARAPKTALLDAGLAARLLGVGPASLAAAVSPDAAGPLMETFVLSELRKQLPHSDTQSALFHFRDLDGPEVDVILDAPDGRVAAVEVKAAASLGDADFRGLKHLRDKLGERFTAGVVLYTGRTAVPWGDRLAGVPLSTLWNG
jgi:predicted AAA+ superfamily ATPase